MIKRINFLICVAGMMTAGCKKQTGLAGDFATLRILGLVDNNVVIVSNFGGKDLPQYENARNINGVSVIPELLNTYVYQSPQPLWFHAFPDTMPGAKPLLALNLELEKGATYNLFVAGPINDLDTFLMKDSNQPNSTKDSVTHVRFVNLMRDQRVSVNLAGQSYGSLASDLGYKEYGGFSTISINHTVEVLKFEFRDADTGELLLEQEATAFYETGSDWIYKYRTVVFAGVKGASGDARPRIIWFNSF